MGECSTKKGEEEEGGGGGEGGEGEEEETKKKPQEYQEVAVEEKGEEMGTQWRKEEATGMLGSERCGMIMIRRRTTDGNATKKRRRHRNTQKQKYRKEGERWRKNLGKQLTKTSSGNVSPRRNAENQASRDTTEQWSCFESIRLKMLHREGVGKVVWRFSGFSAEIHEIEAISTQKVVFSPEGLWAHQISRKRAIFDRFFFCRSEASEGVGNCAPTCVP